MTAARELTFLATGGETGRAIAARDWSGTPLGPIDSWPPALWTSTGIMLESAHPVLIAWGPEFTLLYNDAFATLLGDRHPAALGASGREALADLWPTVGPTLHDVLEKGEGAHVEMFRTSSCSPVRDSDGRVLGVVLVGENDRLEGSQEAFRSLAEHADDVIGRHDLDGTWRYVSPSVERASGHRPAELVGRSPLEFVHPDDRDEAVALFRGVGPERPGSAVLRFRHADGTHRWFETRVRLVHDDRSGEAELHSSKRDVTDRMLAEQELRRFRSLAERATDLTGIADADGRVLYLNPAGRSLLGIGADEPASDIGILDTIAPADRDRFVRHVLPEVQRVGSWTGEVEFVDRAGTSIPTRQQVFAHRDLRGRLEFYSTVAQDLRERRRADGALHEERERYRSLFAQAPVGIWVTDPAGATTSVNDQMAAMAGRPAGDLLGPRWTELVHPDDVSATAASWAESIRSGGSWHHDYRMELDDGTVLAVTSSARPLRDAAGAVTGFLGTTVDVTEHRRAELIRRGAATEHAAREVTDAAAARLRAMVDGLAAIVWEADWDAERAAMVFTFVSDRAEELLGYTAAELRGDPRQWTEMIHPDDRSVAVNRSLDQIAAGRDHDVHYRAVAVDGRVVWLHQVVHVVCDADGRPQRVQGLAVDVTEQKRAERSTELLAEAGRLLTDGSGTEERLAALASLAMDDFGDGAIVSMIGQDGLLRRVAVAHPDPGVERALLALAPTTLPPELAAELALGAPVLIPVTDELNRAASRDGDDADARAALGARSTLLVPLIADDRIIGILGFLNLGQPRYYDASDRALAAELGRRASLMVQSERRRIRERHMRHVSAELASAATVQEAAQRLVARLSEVVGAGGVSVYLAEPQRGLQLVHSMGYSAEQLRGFASIRLDEPVPLAQVARTGEPVWIGDRDAWRRLFPHLLPRAVAADRSAAAALPLTDGGRVVGAIGMSFGTQRAFPAEERDFLLALVAQAAPAFGRAAVADVRRQIAETLQQSLLPATLPELGLVALAARYLPGARGTAAGGDWYDVLTLDGDRVTIAVGDVVGQGARAAAVMGQLRSALSGYLLEGHEPVPALELLDRFAERVPGAAGSTVACLVLDTATGELIWARAGHPPPLVVGPDGFTYLEDAGGTVLAVRGRPPYSAGRATLRPGDSVVLYTDGLVERRGESIDDGLQRLADAAQRNHRLAPEPLTAAVLAGALAAAGPADDVAVIVARLLPAPLRRTLPARPDLLRVLRADVQQWALAAGLTDDTLYDLQLSLGEAAANAVEHAYRGGAAGTMDVELTREPDGAVAVRVRDRGRWRPPPEDTGYRGRGLDLIREVSTRWSLDHGPDGTDVRFTVQPVATPPPAAAPAPAPRAQPSATGLRAGMHADAPCVAIVGDLDLAGVRSVRDELMAHASAVEAPVVDLRSTPYLASAGVALVGEVNRRCGGTLRLLVPRGGVVRRVLQLSGLDRVVTVESVDETAETADTETRTAERG